VVSIQNALPEVAEIKIWRKFSRLSARQMKYQFRGYASQILGENFNMQWVSVILVPQVLINGHKQEHVCVSGTAGLSQS